MLTFRSSAHVVTHIVELPRWQGPEMSIAVLADLHVSAPWTSLADIRQIVTGVNLARPDLIILAGDYLVDAAIPGRRANAIEIVAVLEGLEAPLGVAAILGNHDWQDCPLAKQFSFERNSIIEAVEPTAIRLLRNNNLTMEHLGQRFGLVGFDSQLPRPKDWKNGFHRPDIAFEGLKPGHPTILLAHEPDYFVLGDTRADLQISGHTHGGQLNLFGWRPMTPSQFGGRYAYGHIRDGDRQMIVSGGIGFSGLPMRIGQPPEVTFIKIRGVSTN